MLAQRLAGRYEIAMSKTSSALYPRRLVERFPLAYVPWPAGVAISGALVAAAFAIRAALDSALPPGFPYLTFFPVVLVSAFLFGSRTGTATAIACGLLAWYYFIPPAGFAISAATGVALAFYVFIAATQIAIIHWMQRANRALALERETSARLAQTRELLFRELQHRVSNNLQMVGGLLSLQKKQVSDATARAALDEAARRLGVIGRISRQLYDPAGADLAMGDFLEELTGDVVEASGHRGVERFVTVSSDVVLTPEAAIPLALIVAEAVANAIEHGFAGRATGRVDIRLDRVAADRVRLEVEDDGNGLPAGFAIDATSSLGLKIASMLASQLGGAFTLTPAAGGAVARLDLPA